MKTFVRRALLACWLVALAAPCPARAQETAPPATQLEGVVEPLDPKRPRAEAEDDRLVSAAHFGKARILLNRGDRSAALRHFQRAWRYNPAAVSLLPRIVSLAAELDRHEVAGRYAVIAGERNPENAKFLVQLGGLLVERDETDRALSLFEKAVALMGDAPPTSETVALQIEMGRLYFLRDDLEKAAQSFARVRDALDDPAVLDEEQRRQLLSKPDVLYALMAESFLGAGRLDEAAAMFEQAAAAGSDAGALDFQRARISARRQQYPQARQQLDKYLQAKQSSAGTEPYELLHELLAKTAPDAAQARAELLAVLLPLHKDDPANAALGYYCAEQLRGAERWDEAAAIYAALLKVKPTADGYQGLLDIYRRQGRADQLLDVLAELVERTRSLDAVESDVQRIVEDEQLLQGVFESLRRQAQQAPDQPGAAARLAATLLAIQAGRHEAAAEFAELAVESAGAEKIEVLRRIALAMFLGDDADRAAALFQRALDEQPDDDTAAALWFYLAGAHAFADRHEAALAAAEKAAQLKPDAPRFQSRPPWILYHAQRYDDAQARYRELLERFDGDYRTPGARDVVRQTRLILSNLCVAQQQLAAAEEWLEQVLDEFPEDIGALNDLGYLWADQGKHLHRALAMAQQAVRGEPDNVAYLDSLGWAYYRLGRYDLAVAELEKAAAGEGTDGVILDHLGDAYLKNDQLDKALATWEKAVGAFRAAEDTKHLPATEAKLKKHRPD